MTDELVYHCYTYCLLCLLADHTTTTTGGRTSYLVQQGYIIYAFIIPCHSSLVYVTNLSSSTDIVLSSSTLLSSFPLPKMSYIKSSYLFHPSVFFPLHNTIFSIYSANFLVKVLFVSSFSIHSRQVTPHNPNTNF